MTTNQTIDGVLVSREVLERIFSYQWFPSGGVVTFDHRRLDRENLRTLLDEDICTSCDGSGEYTDAIGDWRGYCSCAAGLALKNKPAAQLQGQPVAPTNAQRRAADYKEQQAFNDWAWNKEGEAIGRMDGQAAAIEAWHARAKLAEHPAPVSVVMPSRIAGDHLNEMAQGWNACIDAANRINDINQ